MEKNFITNTRTLMMIIFISFLTILFLFMNIKIRNERIAELEEKLQQTQTEGVNKQWK